VAKVVNFDRTNSVAALSCVRFVRSLKAYAESADVESVLVRRFTGSKEKESGMSTVT
jgi:hypothetical protein